MNTGAKNWGEQMTEAIDAQRQRASRLLERERLRVRNVESTLLEHLQELTAEIAAIEVNANRREAELACRADELEWQSLSLEEQLSEREGESDVDAADQPDSTATIDEPDDAVRSDTSKVKRTRERTATLDKIVRLESDLERARHLEVELRRQLAQCQRQLDARGEALNMLRTQMELLASGDEGSDDLLRELAELKSERSELLAKIESLEQQVAEMRERSGDSEELEEMQRRFEMAVEGLRELKQANEELSEELARKGGSSGTTNAKSSGSHGDFDWETQKRRMLAQLETDDDPMTESDRLSIEGTIRITDEMIAERDQEIQQLKRRVEQLTRKSHNDAAPAPETLVSDEAIEAEKERLRELQDEYHDKMRQAEIDISLERAKLARERAELEQQRHEMESRLKKVERAPEDGTVPRGRWLTRLGISRDEN